MLRTPLGHQVSHPGVPGFLPGDHRWRPAAAGSTNRPCPSAGIGTDRRSGALAHDSSEARRPGRGKPDGRRQSEVVDTSPCGHRVAGTAVDPAARHRANRSNSPSRRLTPPLRTSGGVEALCNRRARRESAGQYDRRRLPGRSAGPERRPPGNLKSTVAGTSPSPFLGPRGNLSPPSAHPGTTLAARSPSRNVTSRCAPGFGYAQPSGLVSSAVRFTSPTLTLSASSRNTAESLQKKVSISGCHRVCS